MKLKVAIIGMGRMGKAHYNIYRQNKEIGKIYLIDINPEALDCFKETSLRNYKNILEKVDLASVTAPTTEHFKIAYFFIKNKIPVLIEKPITCTVNETTRLINLSKQNKTLIFAGHVERYNKAYIAIKKIINNPQFIECDRLSPYPYRSSDISVVLDLMIHDLDIILDLVKSKIKNIAARGVKVLSPTTDIANVQLTFDNGCIANVTSSRISVNRERKLRIFMPQCYVSMDYIQQEVNIYQKIKNNIIMKNLIVNKEPPLAKEISKFISLIKQEVFTTEYAQKAKDALALSLRIQRKIQKENNHLLIKGLLQNATTPRRNVRTL